jgi:hypothetical protein
MPGLGNGLPQTRYHAYREQCYRPPGYGLHYYSCKCLIQTYLYHNNPSEGTQMHLIRSSFGTFRPIPSENSWVYSAYYDANAGPVPNHEFPGKCFPKSVPARGTSITANGGIGTRTMLVIDPPTTSLINGDATATRLICARRTRA